MKVDSLRLQQFTVFEDVELAFSPGINVFLGTNGTGKSHAMKALYAPLKAMEQLAAERRDSAGSVPDVPGMELLGKLVQVFKPTGRDPRRLIRRASGDGPATVSVSVGGQRASVQIRRDKRHTEVDTGADIGALFLPPRELLSMFEGFLPAYKSRELSFDETYFDTCLALSASVLRGERYEETAPLRAPIERAIGGTVVLEGTRFVLRRPDGDMEPQLLAEGWRKLASVAHLIANGSLSPGTAFFWDEPEAGLNPQMIVLVFDLLLALAERDVQVFVATHDYLLSRKLSLISEYNKRPSVPMRFFGFQRSADDGPVTVASRNTVEELPEDPILDEYVRNYDFSRDLFDGAEGSP